MTFDSYRIEFLNRAQNCGKNKDASRQLSEICSQSLKAYLGFDEISLKEENDPTCPFDIWGIAHKTLYLIKVDPQVFNRDDVDIVGREILGGIFAPLVSFVEQSANFNGIRNTDNLRSIVAELISKLAHGESDNDVECVKIVPFVFDELDSRCSMEMRLTRFAQLKCLAQPMSLYSIWQQGHPIPELPDQITSNTQISPEKTEETPDADNDFFGASEDYQSVYSKSTENRTLKEIMIAEARGSGLTHYNLFTKIIETLEEIGEYEDIEEVHCSRSFGRKPFAIDGWHRDTVSNILTFFILDPDTSDTSFTKTDLDRLSTKIKNFVEYSFRGALADTILDLSTPEGSLSNQLYEIFKEHSGDTNLINRVNLVVFTLRNNNIKSKYDSTECMGIECRSSVIDIEELQDRTERLNNNATEIDFMSKQFGGMPIQMLQTVSRPDIGYKAYLGKMRADVLANLYDEYGQKVLASNVRAFLLTKVKVNKGIQKTIKEEPDNFFAYNNGICVVASDIKTEDRAGVTLMSQATDFQIVNGGQTTASLHYALKKKIPISKIYVPMKLSVVPVESDEFNRDIFVQNISAYANSQNKVSDSDLGTNTHFQIQFQKMGEHCPLFRSDRSMYFWYYERARGTYRVETIKAKMKSTAKKDQFAYRYPLKFDKTDMAKWMKAWSAEPYIANVGGQKCFLDFSKDLIKKEKAVGLDFCSEDFFKHVVGKGILFRHIDALVGNSDWYKVNRSYKINTVGYTMGLLKVVIGKMFPCKDLDFLSIWNRQRIPEPSDKQTFDAMSLAIAEKLDPLLEVLIRHTREIFNHPERTVDDVGEWVKKPACWDFMIKDLPEVSSYADDLESCLQNIREDFLIKSWRDKEK